MYFRKYCHFPGLRSGKVESSPCGRGRQKRVREINNSPSPLKGEGWDGGEKYPANLISHPCSSPSPERWRELVFNIGFFILLLGATAAYANDLPVNWHDLPEPYATPSAVNPPEIIPRPADAALFVPAGFHVEEYLSGFAAPRFMLMGPRNEILLSDMAAGIVYVIHDKRVSPLITNLDRPYGLALYKNWLYVAEASSVKRYVYDAGAQHAGKGEEVIPLYRYAGGHFTRSLLFDEKHNKLYLTVGSGSNVNTGEPPIRATISRYNPDGSGFELFATGIRNPVGLRWYPGTGDLWITANERDGLGDDLAPDFLTHVTPGGFYGWPYAYTGPHEDPRHKGEAPELVKKTLYPDVLLGSHAGSLDLLFYTGRQFPEKYQGGAFVALHGSWNRSQRVGYKLVFIPFRDGRPQSGPEDFLTGWMLDEDKKEVWGRPVGLLQLPDGSLLVSDDGAGKLWRITYTGTNE
jgi:glucose/arabinose dehydrogenase